MNSSWRYRNVLLVAIIGLVLIGVGLGLAYLSTPSRFSIHIRDDRMITLFSGTGLFTTVIGVGVLLKAISQRVVAIPLKMRRDINLGFGLGTALQAMAFVEMAFVKTDPSMTMVLLLAALPLIVWASMRYAEVKGYSTWFGALGVLGIFGLFVLLLLPTRTEQGVGPDSKVPTS